LLGRISRIATGSATRLRILPTGGSINRPTYDDWVVIRFRFFANELPAGEVVCMVFSYTMKAGRRKRCGYAARAEAWEQFFHTNVVTNSDSAPGLFCLFTSLMRQTIFIQP